MPRGQLFQVRVDPLVRHVFGTDRIRKRFQDVALGEAWEADTRADVAQAVAAAKHGVEARAARVDLSPETTLREAAYRWIEDRPLEASTRRMYRQHLDPHVMPTLGDAPLSSIGKARLLEHLATRHRGGASARQLRLDVILLQGIIKYAAELGWKVDASALLVAKPKAPRKLTRPFDPRALDRAIAKLEPRDRVVAEVALATGMRSAELRAMDCSWIRWHTRQVVVPAALTKSKKDRPLPMGARLRSVLRAWLGGRTAGPVFPPLRTRGNAPAMGRDMRRIAGKLKALAPGAVATGLHDLRHAYLSGLAAKGLEVEELRKLAGHSSVTTTEIYMHSAPGRHLDRARRLLDTHTDTRKRRAGAKR